MGLLDGKVALVTGGSRGIGRAIALRLAEEGADLAICARNVAAVGEVAAAIETLGRRCLVRQADVADAEQAAELVAATIAELGRLDVLVNNAGITRDGTLHRMEYESWDDVIRTNLSSCFNCSRAVIEGMRGRKFGRIVNIGSINGQGGQYGQVNYAAAKSGIHGFTKALAQEGAAQGITVNAIAPGYVDTDMVRAVPERVLERIVERIPVGRLGTAHDIARGVLFLTSDGADFITGSTLSINGGQHMY